MFLSHERDSECRGHLCFNCRVMIGKIFRHGKTLDSRDVVMMLRLGIRTAFNVTQTLWFSHNAQKLKMPIAFNQLKHPYKASRAKKRRNPEPIFSSIGYHDSNRSFHTYKVAQQPRSSRH
uniref:WGS project CBMI000000000 data, contig CS3069_c002711 n=1 Tax=Fusarium clavum TaxID=2594811 RepID=A0A090MD42_9HYPO|nr:unnamed protein product [Fusarium clavum]